MTPVSKFSPSDVWRQRIPIDAVLKIQHAPIFFFSYLDSHPNWNYCIARKNWTLLVTHAKLSLRFKCVLMTSIIIDSMLLKVLEQHNQF